MTTATLSAAPTKSVHTPVTTAALADALAETLAGLIAEHEALAAITPQQRTAMAAADHATLASLTSLQRQHIHNTAVLDSRRHDLSAQLATRLALHRPAQPAPTISAIAAALALQPSTGAAADRLLTLAARLKETLLRLQREHQVVRSAAETIFAHIDGIMDQVARRLSQAATYSRRGTTASWTTPAATGHLACALDMTT